MFCWHVRKEYRQFHIYLAYNEFKNQRTNIKDIGELTKVFRKEFCIPDRVAIPADLNNLINSV
jgi:hypothetical protein